MRQKYGHLSKTLFPKSSLWNKLKKQGKPNAFVMEITGRCNNNCRHCYINLAPNDKEARNKELSFREIKHIVDEAVSLGLIWCNITGGEPLLRKDFRDIYLYLKKKGILISLLTNGTLLNPDYISLFKKYPLRDIEITVYGVTKKTYEKISRIKGSFSAFMHGVEALVKNGIPLRLKAMALNSNYEELPLIMKFCRRYSSDNPRFDPFLHLRIDGDEKRNEEIESERLSPERIIAAEQLDLNRLFAFKNYCKEYLRATLSTYQHNNLFPCNFASSSFIIGYDGFYRHCLSLHHPDYIYDLKKGSIVEAQKKVFARVQSAVSNRKEFLDHCRNCKLIEICMWCPAQAYLETGQIDAPIDYFCRVARARKKLGNK